MFTGIVTAVGALRTADAAADGRRFRIQTPSGFLSGVARGESIAVDGVCLTVTDHDEDGFAVDVIGTTLSRTTLGDCQPGRLLNLERPLALGDRLDGHLVQGHVDGTGTVRAVARTGEHVLLDVSLPAAVADVTVLHGSIAIDGVSLTVNALPPGGAQVALIPYTWEHTNLRRLVPGDRVNLEGDMLGRFVVHYLARRDPARVDEEGRTS